MTIPNSYTVFSPFSSAYNCIKESIPSKKQPLIGLAIQGLGHLIALQAESYPGKIASQESRWVALGTVIGSFGSFITAISEELTIPQSKALIISGLALMTLNLLFEDTTPYPITGAILISSGVMGFIIAKGPPQLKKDELPV